jgi:hypothetical protein
MRRWSVTAAARCPGLSAGGCAGVCGGRWPSWRSRSSAPPRSWPRPGPGWPGRSQTATRLVSLHDPDARPIRKAASTSRPGSGTRPRSPATTTASFLDYSVEYGAAPDDPELAPAIQRAGRMPGTVTADRGYGQPVFDRDLRALGVRTVAIPAEDLLTPQDHKAGWSASRWDVRLGSKLARCGCAAVTWVFTAYDLEGMGISSICLLGCRG